MMYSKTLIPALPFCFMAACTAPDIGPSVADAQVLLEASAKATAAPLKAEAARELQAAEFAAAQRGERIIKLPSSCLQGNVDLANSVGTCRVIEEAKPVDGPVNATQVLLAQSVMRDYFAVLADLNDAKTPADIRKKTAAAFSAFDAFAQTRDSATLARLAETARQRGPAVSAISGFAAEQARLAATRRMVRRADPVLDDLVRGIQPVFLRLGDPVAQDRAKVVDAYAAYNTLVAANNPNAAVRAAQKTKDAVARMHRTEAKSPLRQLYLARDLNAAILAALTANPSLEDFDRISAEIAEIAMLLET